MVVKGKLEIKFPTIWTDDEAKVGRVREAKSRREKIQEETASEERRCRRAKKVAKSCNIVFLQLFVAPKG